MSSYLKRDKKALREALLKSRDSEYEGGLNEEALRIYDEAYDKQKKYKEQLLSKLSDEDQIQGLDQFSNYGKLFSDLTKRQHIDTGFDVVTIIITYDSQYCVAIVRNGDAQYDLQSYSLRTFKSHFKRSYDGDFLKMALIEQTLTGKTFCIAYQDNGEFFISFVDQKGEELDNFNVTEYLGIDNTSLPLADFYEPRIAVSFIEDDNVMVSVYHRGDKT